MHQSLSVFTSHITCGLLQTYPQLSHAAESIAQHNIASPYRYLIPHISLSNITASLW
jgi:hypothetical protein